MSTSNHLLNEILIAVREDAMHLSSWHVEEAIGEWRRKRPLPAFEILASPTLDRLAYCRRSLEEARSMGKEAWETREHERVLSKRRYEQNQQREANEIAIDGINVAIGVIRGAEDYLKTAPQAVVRLASARLMKLQANAATLRGEDLVVIIGYESHLEQAAESIRHQEKLVEEMRSEYTILASTLAQLTDLRDHGVR